MICPVCLAPLEASDDDLTPDHGGDEPCLMSGRPMFHWDERSTRESVRGRSNGICEYCQQRAATDCHHRVSAGVGGRWRPANILHICREDHSYFTDRPHLAYPIGVMVKRHDERGDPEDIPITRADGTELWLTDLIAPPLPAWARKQPELEEQREP